MPTGLWGEGRIRRPSPFERLGVTMGEYTPDSTFRIVFDSDPRNEFEPDGGVTMSVNALGLRGPDVARTKPPGTFRVLGLGDSFTFGVGVPDEQTFLRRLESSLREAPDSTAFEVLNAGVQGYNTRDEVTVFEQRWIHLQPDLVVLTFYLNDAYSDAAFWNMGQGLGIHLQQPDGLAQVSVLADLVQHAWRARGVQRKMKEHYDQHYFQDGNAFLASDAQDAPFRVDWGVSRAALERARDLTREKDIQFAVVLFPELHALNEDYPFQAIHDVVGEACRELDIPLLDLFETFRGHDASSLWVHPSDHHPNGEAHRLAAASIEAFLRREKLLP